MSVRFLSTTKANVKRNEANWAMLKQNDVHPIHMSTFSKLTKATLHTFIGASKGLFQEEIDLPRVCTSDGFDLNSYKLMKRSGYDFNKPTSLRHII